MTFRILSFCTLPFIPQKKIRIEFSANYPLTTFRIPQSAFLKIPLPGFALGIWNCDQLCGPVATSFYMALGLLPFLQMRWAITEAWVCIHIDCTVCGFIMAAYEIGQAIIVLPCDFYLLSSIFFPCLISAAADWMSTILLRMTWP